MNYIALFLRVVMLCLISGYGSIAFAHAPGHSYLYLSFTEEAIAGRVEIPVSELERGFGQDSPIIAATGSQQPNPDLVLKYVDDHLRLSAADRELEIGWSSSDIVELEGSQFASLEFSVLMPAPQPEKIGLELDFMTKELSDHRVGLVIEDNPFAGVVANHTQLSYFFSQTSTNFDYYVAGRSLLDRLLDFIYEGVIHIWLGFDHVLFLVCLLLSSVVTRPLTASTTGAVAAQTNLKQSLFNVVTIVTVFTIAHSITLAFALKGWVTLPSRLVESIIALSVLAVAIDNLRPIFGRWKWTIVFLFGLFHGLGFASVLIALNLAFQSKVVALIGFNVGVEVGQLVIVALLFPVLFALRHHSYRRFVLVPGSVAIALISIWWLVSRVFEIESGWTSF